MLLEIDYTQIPNYKKDNLVSGVKGIAEKLDATDFQAYGELVKGESVNSWTTEEIRLKYKDTNRRPTHIIISCSSSKLGDYLTGSYNSILWVDNFELVYDENVVLWE